MTSDSWLELRERARDAAADSYAPYSGLHVGAAGRTDTGRIVTGCNVENASYGLTLCAECGLVSDLHRTGGGRLVEVTTVDESGALLSPCGGCRQLFHEAGGPELLVDGVAGPRPLAELLPGAFDWTDLPDPP